MKYIIKKQNFLSERKFTKTFENKSNVSPKLQAQSLNNFELIQCIKKGYIDTFLDIIESGNYNINFRTRDKYTPLITAVQYGEDIMAKKLIEKGAGLDLQTSDGRTALIESAFRSQMTGRNLDMIRTLIDNGADWTIRDMHNNCFLDFLSNEDQDKIIKEYPGKFEDFEIQKNVNKYNL